MTNHSCSCLLLQLLAVKQEAELLRSQLHTVTQEKIGHAQEVVELRRKLLEVQSQVRSPPTPRYGEVLHLTAAAPSGGGAARTNPEAAGAGGGAAQTDGPKPAAPGAGTAGVGGEGVGFAAPKLIGACLCQVSELQVQELQVHKLSQDQQNLRTRLSQAEAARTQALDQVRGGEVRVPSDWSELIT